MARGMSDDVSNVIVQALARGLSRGQISGVVGVSKRAITRINANLRKHGTPKAPPSGAKIGRPAKLSNAQADAMLLWMMERNHTFYVKDLVQHLRDHHDFVGCDGTVRRGLIKAGFKRKLPWHKSEITTWVPPEHASAADEDADGDDGDDRGDLDAHEDANPLPNHPNVHLDERPHSTPGNDTIGAHIGALTNTEGLSAPRETYSSSDSNPLLDPMLQGPLPTLSSPDDASQYFHQHDLGPMIQDHMAMQAADPIQLAAQMLTLQDALARQQEQNARQQEIIAQLQRQLADTQALASPSLAQAALRGQGAQYSSPYAMMPGAGEI